MTRGEFYVDPLTLDPIRRATRAAVLTDMLREVAAGADGRCTVAVIQAALRTDGGEDVADEVADLAASDLPGKWHLVTEEWQGLERDYFVAKGIYVDETTCCVVRADAGVGEDPHVDSMWLDPAELREMAGLL